MRLASFGALLACGLAGALPATSAAAEDAPTTAATHFAAGSSAFEAADYAQARREFEAALASGGDDAAARYNLAVSYYRLDELDLAAQTFRDLGRDFPQFEQLASYNVGLTLTRSGDTAGAHAAFTRALTGDDKIAALAATMLARLPPEAAPPSVPPWERFADVVIGHDSNVALLDAASLPAGESTDSAFAALGVYVGGPAGSRGLWDIDVTGYLVDYPDAGAYDQHGVLAGALRAWQRGAWRFAAGPQAGYATLDGDGLERRVGAAAEVRRSLGAATEIGAAWLGEDIDSLADRYAYTAGNYAALRIWWTRPTRHGRVTIDLRDEHSDRAVDAIDVDYGRYGVRFRRALRERWSGEIHYEHRRADYAALLPPRTEKRDQVALAATRRDADRWFLTARLSYADNDSTDATYAYDRTLLAMSFGRSF